MKMFDPISDAPLILAYVFMSLLVLILCFIMFNVAHKVFYSTSDEGVAAPTRIYTKMPFELKSTTTLELATLKTG